MMQLLSISKRKNLQILLLVLLLNLVWMGTAGQVNQSNLIQDSLNVNQSLLLVQAASTANSYTTPDFVVVPPSPAAAQLGKFESGDVGMYTGTAQYTIPLYTFETPNYSLPISLNYSSNGLKVDELATWVGYNWTLSAGGVVTRNVKGHIDKPGYLHSFPTGFYNWTDEAKENYLSGIISGSTDLEPDIFIFNLPGVSGKFAFDAQGQPLIFPFKKLKIETNSTGGDYNYFNITTTDGIVYKFSEIETSINSATLYSYNSSWYLKKIIHPTGDSITFSYTTGSVRQYLSIMQSATAVVETQNNTSCAPTSENIEKVVYSDNMLVFLNKIDFHKYGTVLFDITADRADAAGEYKLNKITVQDGLGNTIKSFKFWYQYPIHHNSYPSKAPLGSFSAPHNNHHKYRMFLDSLQILDKSNYRVSSYIFEYNNLSELPARFSYSQDHWGYFNGKLNEDFAILNLVPDPKRGYFTNIINTNANRKADSNFSKKGMLNKITFPTGGYTTFEYEANRNSSGFELGGSRVIRVKTYDSPTSTPIIKKFNYLSPVTQIDTSYYHETRFGCHDAQKNILGLYTLGTISSNSLFNLYIDGKNPIIYQNVEVWHGENKEFGRTAYFFETSFDSPGTPIVYCGSYSTQYFSHFTKSNAEIESGLKISEDNYEYNGALKRKETTSYNKLEARKYRKILCMAVNKRPNIGVERDLCFYDIIPYDINSRWYYINSISETNYETNGNVTKTTNYFYEDSVHNQITRENYINSAGQTIETRYYYPDNYGSTFNTLKSKFIVGKPIDIRTYNGTQLIDGVQYLYNNNGQITNAYKPEVLSGGSINFNPGNAYTFSLKLSLAYSNNCIVQETPANDISTFYLWDGTGKYLMAKINDPSCNWNSIQTLNGKACSYSSKTLFNDIKGLYPNAIINTYSHTQLTGLTEFTDGTGVTTRYSFDNIGRVSEVKNDDSKLLQKYQYRYRR